MGRIRCNVISYMLKPLTVKGLGEELRTIHQKIDARFAAFRETPPQTNGQRLRGAMLAPLVLDGHAESDGQLEAYARQCGLLWDGDGQSCYIVMVSALLREEGTADTPIMRETA